MYFRRSGDEVMSVAKRNGLSSGAVDIYWTSASPTPGIHYQDEREVVPLVRARKGAE